MMPLQPLEIWQYLQVEFPAVIGHIPLKHGLAQLEQELTTLRQQLAEKERELNETVEHAAKLTQQVHDYGCVISGYRAGLQKFFNDPTDRGPLEDARINDHKWLKGEL